MKDFKFGYKGAYKETDKEIEIYLQRQGCTTTKNCAHPLFFVEISHHNGKNSIISEINYSCNPKIYGRKYGQISKSSSDIYTENEGLEFIKIHVSELTGKKITINPQVISYCYSFGNYDIQKDDLFLSSCCYEEYSDTIRHIVSNVCLVAFEGENRHFKDYNFDVDKAALKYRILIEKALYCGFHQCDTDKGDDHCKRRLAWLLGEYIKEGINDGVNWCNQDMSRVKK